MVEYVRNERKEAEEDFNVFDFLRILFFNVLVSFTDTITDFTQVNTKMINDWKS